MLAPPFTATATGPLQVSAEPQIQRLETPALLRQGLRSLTWAHARLHAGSSGHFADGFCGVGCVGVEEGRELTCLLRCLDSNTTP